MPRAAGHTSSAPWPHAAPPPSGTRTTRKGPGHKPRRAPWRPPRGRPGAPRPTRDRATRHQDKTRDLAKLRKTPILRTFATRTLQNVCFAARSIGGNDDNDGSESARTVWRKDTRAPGGGQRYDDGSESRRARPRRPTRHRPRRAPPHAGRTGAGPESRAEAALEDHAPTPGPLAPRPERGLKSGPKKPPRP